MREGYSPHFGARPLKRTVERLVLLPLARAISGGALVAGSLLKLTHHSGHVEILIVQRPPPQKLPPTQDERHARAFQAEAGELVKQFDELETQVQPLADRKSELLRQTQDRGFYQDAARRAATFDEIHKLDQFDALLIAKQG